LVDGNDPPDGPFALDVAEGHVGIVHNDEGATVYDLDLAQIWHVEAMPDMPLDFHYVAIGGGSLWAARAGDIHRWDLHTGSNGGDPISPIPRDRLAPDQEIEALVHRDIPYNGTRAVLHVATSGPDEEVVSFSEDDGLLFAPNAPNLGNDGLSLYVSPDRLYARHRGGGFRSFSGSTRLCDVFVGSDETAIAAAENRIFVGTRGGRLEVFADGPPCAPLFSYASGPIRVRIMEARCGVRGP